MKLLSNAHSHTRYCDGKNTVQEMVEAAKGLGFVSLGFSGHGDQGFDEEYAMMGGRQQRYQEEIRALQQAGTALPRLWLGVEEDTLTPEEQQTRNRRELDYVIGSTHYLEKEWQGQPVAVDGEPEQLMRYVRQCFDGDGLAMAQRYFDLHVAGLLAGRPTIIGHFDLVRKYAKPLKLFDEESPEYSRMASAALEKAFPCGGVLEVNTGAMARGTMDTPYPTLELLGVWRELGGQVTVTSDCHDGAKLDYGFDTAVKLLMRAGFRTVLRLGTGNELWEEVRLMLCRG